MTNKSEDPVVYFVLFESKAMVVSESRFGRDVGNLYRIQNERIPRCIKARESNSDSLKRTVVTFSVVGASFHTLISFDKEVV